MANRVLDFKHENWSSRAGFLLASLGGAVGLGNLWRFPYIAGENGGGGFVLIYIAFVFGLGLPVMIGEMIIGRRGKQSAVSTMRNLVESGRRSPVWKLIGWLSVLVPFVGMSYYAVVAAWSMDYLGLALLDSFHGFSAQDSQNTFNLRIAQPLRQTLLHGAFVALTAFVVGRGVQNGIEAAAKIMMPGLFILLLVLIAYNMIAADFARAVRFLFEPDFSQVTGKAVLMALGQALFSIAVGVGMMITYSAYLPQRESLQSSAAVICVGDTVVAILAGLAIFPIVFQAGLDPAGGPSLIFVTLPVAFGQMPGGAVLGPVFFLLLFFAAYTSSIGMLEPGVAWLVEHKGARRGVVAALAGVAVWLAGLVSIFSFNLLSDVHPLAFLSLFEGKTFFDIVDFTIANIFLPLNALLIALFVGWSLKPATTREELRVGDGFGYRYWLFAVRFLVPAALVAIIVDLWT